MDAARRASAHQFFIPAVRSLWTTMTIDRGTGDDKVGGPRFR